MHLKKTYHCLDWVQQNFLCFLAPCWIGKAVKQEVHKNQFMCEWNIWMTVELTHGPMFFERTRWLPEHEMSARVIPQFCLRLFWLPDGIGRIWTRYRIGRRSFPQFSWKIYDLTRKSISTVFTNYFGLLVKTVSLRTRQIPF